MASGTIEMDIIIIIKELKFWHVHVWIHGHLRTWALYEDYTAVQIWPHDLHPPLLQSPLHVTPLIPGSILNWQCSSSFQCFRQRGSWHLAQRCLQSRCELCPSFSPWQCPCHWRWLWLRQTLWVPLPWQICKCWKCVCVHHVNPLGPRPAAATKSLVKGSNCVKWSWYTTLKINNKHQTKVSAHFVFSPVCEYSVRV